MRHDVSVFVSVCTCVHTCVRADAHMRHSLYLIPKIDVTSARRKFHRTGNIPSTGKRETDVCTSYLICSHLNDSEFS